MPQLLLDAIIILAAAALAAPYERRAATAAAVAKPRLRLPRWLAGSVANDVACVRNPGS
jgi:hypothetical protein